MKTQLPQSLLEFQRMFPGEPECAAYLEAIRWPNGFNERQKNEELNELCFDISANEYFCLKMVPDSPG